jgi:TetR/AcrR family tetracycline transcriptional repressor
MNLDRGRIIEAGLDLLRVEGLAALNMRAIAGRLGVRASALYRHFPSKEKLLGEMSARLFLDAQADLPDNLDWSAWLLEFGGALRANLLHFRDSAIMCTTAPPPSEDAQSVARSIAAPLTRRGVATDDALADIASVVAFTVGMTAYQQSEAYAEFLDRMLGFDRAFQRGLEALVRGLAETQPETSRP